MKDKRVFMLEVSGQVVLDIDQSVLDFYLPFCSRSGPLKTVDDIVKHIGYHMIIDRCSLSSIDGFVDLDDSLSGIVSQDIEVEKITEIHTSSSEEAYLK